MMTKSSFLRGCRVALVSTATLVSLAASSHADLIYNVTLNVASLVGNANGPFSIDLLFTPGSGTAVSTNTVTLSNFVFIGGSPIGAPDFTNGDESGTVATSVILGANGDFDNELAQQFSSGVTQISFSVDETTNAVGTTPDQFNVAILDSSLFNIPTNDPSTGNEVLSSAINGSGTTLSSVKMFTSSAPEAGVTVSAVPEPGSVALLFLGAAGLLGWKRSRRSVQMN